MPEEPSGAELCSSKGITSKCAVFYNCVVHPERAKWQDSIALAIWIAPPSAPLLHNYTLPPHSIASTRPFVASCIDKKEKRGSDWASPPSCRGHAPTAAQHAPTAAAFHTAGAIVNAYILQVQEPSTPAQPSPCHASSAMISLSYYMSKLQQQGQLGRHCWHC